MSSNFKYLFIIVSIFLTTACNYRKQEEKQADTRLENIRKLITANKLNEAKSEIDSIHALFPRLVNKRKIAVALNDSIVLRESYRTIKQCAEILPELKNSFELMQKNFVLQKNEKYEEIGKYVYKTQAGEQNTGRNYLMYEVDEKGDVYLSSRYSGEKINQYALKVEAGGMEATTDVNSKNAGVLHAFVDGEGYYEYLTFKNEAIGSIAEFIHANKSLAIRVTLLGNTNKSYMLQQVDKQAISETYKFAQARILLHKTENDLRLAQQRIGKINLLYKE